MVSLFGHRALQFWGLHPALQTHLHVTTNTSAISPGVVWSNDTVCFICKMQEKLQPSFQSQQTQTYLPELMETSSALCIWSLTGKISHSYLWYFKRNNTLFFLLLLCKFALALCYRLLNTVIHIFLNHIRNILRLLLCAAQSDECFLTFLTLVVTALQAAHPNKAEWSTADWLWKDLLGNWFLTWPRCSMNPLGSLTEPTENHEMIV